MFKGKWWKTIGMILVLLLVLAACGGGADEPAEGDGGETAAEEEGDLTGGDNLIERARNGDFSGTTVEIFGAFVDNDARAFEETLAPFEEETGIDITYEGSGDFETLIEVRVTGGDPPDIAAHPQPGVVANLAERGHVIDPSSFLGMDFLQENYADGWLESATFGDQMGGIWRSTNAKSLVWYPKDDFDAAGYEIPTTWDELLALSNTILEEQGVPPWCIGIESSGATGWTATDWIEDIMLRTQPPEVYDAWAAGEHPFDSPEVRNAVETMATIWKDEEMVLGGTVGIVTTPFGDAPTPMFDDPPSCWLHRQSSFIPAFFPDDAVLGENVDFFYFPMIDPEFGEPVLIGGDLMSMYNDRPEVRAVMAHLATGESSRVSIENGNIIAPHKTADLDWYSNDFDRRFAEMIQNATTVRFDASDLMPGAVGAGAFWSEITAWVTGQPLDETLSNIDAAWPSE